MSRTKDVVNPSGKIACFAGSRLIPKILSPLENSLSHNSALLQ